MPRGRKPEPKTYEEKVATIEAEIIKHQQGIEKHQEAIKNLQIKLEDIKAEKEEELLDSLIAAIKNSTKSYEEILNYIQEQSA